MPDTALFVALSDGRRLAYAEYGAPDGAPVVFLHGGGGCRMVSTSFAAAAAAAGIRLISPDRPGIGRSDPRPGLTFGGYAADVRALLDALALPRVTVAGLSGGAGFALGCAARLPDRLDRAVVVSGMAPAPRAASRTMLPNVRLMFFLARWSRPLLARLLRRQLAPADPEKQLAKFVQAAPPADRAVLEQAGRWGLIEVPKEAMRQGAGAHAREFSLYTRPLDFSLQEITVPVHLIHGADDRNVPLAIAEHVASRIPTAVLQVLPDAGHTLLAQQPHVLFDLVAPRLSDPGPETRV